MTNNANWRLEWDEDGEAIVDSRETLDQQLDELTLTAHARPFMAELISPEGDSLALGLGRGKSVLSWVSATQEPPYFASIGNPEEEGTIVFLYRGDWSEFPCWSAVPTVTARRAIREFFMTGKLPSSIEWKEV